VIAVNRDAGTVTVMSVDYTMPNDPSLTLVAELSVGNEPWQVVIDGCDDTAYVVLRKDQKVVQINNLKTTPTVGTSVAVGSEPTSLALTPNNTKLYVSNWVDGNLSVIDPVSMTVTSTIDLNATIAATGFLGADVASAPRPGLAHPRGIAITNNGDGSDADETVFVTEWFAVRTAPEKAGGAGADTNWKGLLYKIPVSSGTPSTLDLPPVQNNGFNDAGGNVTGCFPNQVASVTIENEGTSAAPSYFAHVTSTCASPAGPVGVFQFGACQINANCSQFGNALNPSTCDLTKGVCTASCTSDAQCGVGSAAGACSGNTLTPGECAPFVNNAKTTTHPAVTIVDLATGTGTTNNLDAPFSNVTTPTSTAGTTSATVSTRMPLLPTDMDFKPGFAYVASEGSDALYRLSIINGKIIAVGSAANNFIDLDVNKGAGGNLRLPIGMAISKDKLVAFVANDGTRSVMAVSLNAQGESAGATPELASSAYPTGTAANVQNGKALFNTGLGRWSLKGAAWGSCGACHVDGLTDNVTWYFARGPRQTTSLDGTFNKSDPTDQRILNWTAVNDEVADFETNTRGVSGGVGAIVSTNSTPPATTDRINLISSTPPNTGLEGASAALASGATSSAPTAWANITAYVQQIRSPHAATPSLFAAGDIAAGKTAFQNGNCAGCHGGAKWTVSRVFYAINDTHNDAFSASPGANSLSATDWSAPAAKLSFPAALFPSTTAGKQTDRFGPPTGFEQIQCILRPVGTITANGAIPTGVSDPAVSVQELRADMKTGGQGAGGTNANDIGAGFNIPSLLGVQVGAPYFHAGNARSLEELFSASLFKTHYQSAVANVFDPHNPDVVKQLVAYLLSIDGNTPPPTGPGPGPNGGDICVPPP